MWMAWRLTVFLFSCHRLMQCYLNPHLQGNRFPSITFVTQLLGFLFTSVFPGSVMWLYFILIINNIEYVEHDIRAYSMRLKCVLIVVFVHKQLLFLRFIDSLIGIVRYSNCRHVMILFFLTLTYYFVPDESE